MGEVTEPYKKYIWALHFSMATMTTVGYGDITPTNTAEIFYTILLLWISLVIFSACMGVLMNLMNSMHPQSAAHAPARSDSIYD